MFRPMEEIAKERGVPIDRTRDLPIRLVWEAGLELFGECMLCRVNQMTMNMYMDEDGDLLCKECMGE